MLRTKIHLTVRNNGLYGDLEIRDRQPWVTENSVNTFRLHLTPWQVPGIHKFGNKYFEGLWWHLANGCRHSFGIYRSWEVPSIQLQTLLQIFAARTWSDSIPQWSWRSIWPNIAIRYRILSTISITGSWTFCTIASEESSSLSFSISASEEGYVLIFSPSPSYSSHSESDSVISKAASSAGKRHAMSE